MSSDKSSPLHKGISLLRALRDIGRAARLSELADRTQLDKATTTRLLGDLEADGMVQRFDSWYTLGREIQLFWADHMFHLDQERALALRAITDAHPAENVVQFRIEAAK